MSLNLTKKRLVQYLVCCLVVVFGLFSYLSPTKAAVPVVVFGEYLDLVKDIDDADNQYDLQARINGLLKYTGGPKDTTVTKTQKLPSDFSDKTSVLNDVVQNIDERIAEIDAEIAEEQSKPNPRTELINRLNEAKTELNTLKSEAEDLEASLVQSIALDVHIVKDSTSVIDDLKAIAKEKLARLQVGELSKPLINLYEESTIKNFHDYLVQEPLESANSYLDEVHFKDIGPDESVLPPDKLDETKQIIKDSLQPSYINSAQPKKSPDFVGWDNVFDASTDDPWRQWLLGLQPNNNFYGIYLSGLQSAQEIAVNKGKEKTTQAIAYQGIRPITKESDSGETAPDGTKKKFITMPGSLIADNRAAVTEAQFDLASDPKYASEREAIGVLSTDPEPEAVSFIHQPPYQDFKTSKTAKENVGWWDLVAFNSVTILEDIFCQCFPEFCTTYSIDDIYDMIDFPDITANIPTGMPICGRTFDICTYFPEICSGLGVPIDDLLRGLGGFGFP